MATAPRRVLPSLPGVAAPRVPRVARRSRAPARVVTVTAAAAAGGGGRSSHGPAARAAPASAPAPAAPAAVEAALTAASVPPAGGVVQLYRTPGASAAAAAALADRARALVSPDVSAVTVETCYNVGLTRPLSDDGAATLAWLLRETFEPHALTAASTLAAPTVVEVGPRLSFQSAWSTNAVSVCASCGLTPAVARLEPSRRYGVATASGAPLSADEAAAFAALVHDRMTEQVYAAPLATFDPGSPPPAPPRTVPLLARGKAALAAVDAELGLAFDDQDMDFYVDLFVNKLGRDPTDVELFDMAQSNSEHSRHWFFGAKLVVDGVAAGETLMSIVKSTLAANPSNSVIGFKDNSSAIRGGPASPLLPATPGAPSPLAPARRTRDVLLTAETHNFPCAVAPYPGAETGAGGRIRDTHATGTGSIMGAATAGYCVGELRVGGAPAPWEHADFEYPPSLAPPLQILIDSSNGASDYGNKFGEPLVAGFTRAYGARLPSGERREWIKPIMFSGGLGQIDAAHTAKKPPAVGMLIVKIGGPAYRIGMGGGAASSVPSGDRGGDRGAALDFDAVQRGDAEMAQKLWRVVRACVELGDANPIQQIHDQGAGGNCNVVKEIAYPLGGRVDVRNVALGDATMSVLEIWGAEYQENDCILIKPDDEPLLRSICDRERCLMQVLGSVDGSGRIVVVDSAAPPGTPPPVDLDLELVLGDMPAKTFTFDTASSRRAVGAAPVALPAGDDAAAALDRVLRLPSVCSKRFLTTKVDRSVTGLVARQQCVGPLQLPLADVAVTARDFEGHAGAATAIGEQPLKGLVDPAAMARLALAEALTNLVWAPITALGDVKASVNWMYAAKMGAEGADMLAAARALRDAMLATRVACDGGKDSLSMAATAPGGEVVMAPGNLVVSAYAACTDVCAVVTPDLKLAGAGAIVHVDLASTPGARRVGGSALAAAYRQVGDDCPDVDVAALAAAFGVTQALVRDGAVAAGHDVSDGGAAVALLEMAFAGNVGVTADWPAPDAAASSAGVAPAVAALFAEEPGLLLEVEPARLDAVLAAYAAAGVRAARVGTTGTADGAVSLAVGGAPAVAGAMAALRDAWEATAFDLERLQCARECVAAEQAGLASRAAPVWRLPHAPARRLPPAAGDRPRVAVLREEGSNGDREMAAALWEGGCAPWDVTMSDLIAGRASLADFRGVVFVGGFSYADVLDSAKGWAGAIRGNAALAAAFAAFRARPDTFSLGVCNGCQLMALLGWVPGAATPADAAVLPPPPDAAQPRFTHNASGRFESRWAHVTVLDSPAVLLKGMAGATMGVWVAHGEGRATFPDDGVRAAALAAGLAPVRYANADGSIATSYPANPNGSPDGIAALTSPCGRHLALMPHPERCFLGWQVPWAPRGAVDARGAGPWITLFQNAAAFCAGVGE